MLMLLAALPAVMEAHQFYISITFIQHDPETEKLNVRVKLFINELLHTHMIQIFVE